MKTNDGSLSEKRNFIILTVTIFLAFLVFGFSENVKGPAIPRIQADFGISEFRLGLLLATNSLGYLTACSYTAFVSRKIGLKLTLIICLIGMTLSGAAICFSPGYITLLASYFCMYLGNGMLEIALGLMAAKIFTKNTGTMMNLSHFFYGLSSSFAPLMAAGLMNVRFGSQALGLVVPNTDPAGSFWNCSPMRPGWRYMFLIVLTWALVPIIPALFGKMNRTEESRKHTGFKEFLKDKNAVSVIALLSLGVSCELSVGGWLVNFMEKAYHLDEGSAALVLTAFFICFTAARLVLGPVTDRIGLVKSLLIFTAFSGTAIVAGVLLGKPGIALLVAAGFGIAPIYPTVMAVMVKLFGGMIETAMTVTLTVMGISIVVANFLLGAVIDLLRTAFTAHFGEQGVGMAYSVGYTVIGGFCFGSFAVTSILFKRLKKGSGLV